MLMIQGEGSAPTGPSGGSGGGGPAPKRLPKSKPKAKGKPSAGGGVTHEQPKKPEDLKAELRDLPLYIYITVFVRLLWSEVLMSCQHYTSLKNIYVLLRIDPQERSECYAIDLNGAAQRPPATQDPGAVQTAV